MCAPTPIYRRPLQHQHPIQLPIFIAFINHEDTRGQYEDQEEVGRRTGGRDKEKEGGGRREVRRRGEGEGGRSERK